MAQSRRYLVLAALAVVFGIAAWLGRGVWFTDAFAANLSAGFFGALITVALIDRANEESRERERRRIERIAMQQAHFPLIHLVRLVSDMIKAAMPLDDGGNPRSVAELLSERYARHLEAIDLRGPAGVFPEVEWYQRVPTEIAHVRAELGDLVTKDVAFLPRATVEALEAVRHDQYLGLFRQLSTMRSAVQAQGVAGAYSLEEFAPMRRKAMERIHALLAVLLC